MSVADAQKDRAVSKMSFADEISQAYDVIANSWVQAKEIKVILFLLSCLLIKIPIGN